MYTARQLPRHSSVSGWCALLPPRQSRPALLGDVTADVVVIGGGFAGLAAARRLSQLDRTLRITVLEALAISDGATGRNSGFMIDLPHEVSSGQYAGDGAGDGAGPDRPDIHANRTAIALAREMAEENGWGRDVFDPCGKYNVAMGSQGDHHVQTYAAQLHALGETCRVLDARETAEVTGTHAFTSAVYTPGTVMVQPADYIRRVADFLTRFVTVHEHTPALSIDKEKVGTGWRIRTPQGSVQAARVILATNGHAESFGLFPARLLHVFTYASMTGPFDPQRLGGHPSWAATPALPMGTTVRRVRCADGDRLLIRSRYSYHADQQASAADVARAGRLHDRKFRDRFPMLAGLSMPHRWAGPMALTWNGVPAFGEIEPGLLAACACNGVGATKATASGIAAAEATLGVSSRLLSSFKAQATPRRLPPQPWRTAGVRASLRFREWRAGRE